MHSVKFFIFVAAAAFFLGFFETAQAPIDFDRSKPAREQPIRVLFAGDLMLDRNVARHATASSSAILFAGVAQLFNTADISVANFEGTITNNPSLAQADHTILRFTSKPPLAREALAPLRLSAAGLANNHALDFGASGYNLTREYLQSWGIAPFGHPYDTPSLLSTMLLVRGKKICLVGYHELYDADTSSVVSEIRRLNPGCYRIAVVAHWGEEYRATATPQQRSEAYEFIDAGADLVIGAHPHVVEPVEVYKGKAIFYSLGNFMFDQDFSWATTHGLAVQVEWGETTTSFTLVPLTIEGEEVGVAQGADQQRVLEVAHSLAEFSLP